jgi:hypothetical protein
MKIFCSVLLVGIAACASPDPRKMVRVGYMERDCSLVRNERELPRMPIGLKVTPTEAAQALPAGCFTKFFMDVYADTDNYYFLDNTPTLFSFSGRSLERVKACSFVVDGRSGQLVRPPEEFWSGSPYKAEDISAGRRPATEIEAERTVPPGPWESIPPEKLRSGP